MVGKNWRHRKPGTIRFMTNTIEKQTRQQQKKEENYKLIIDRRPVAPKQLTPVRKFKFNSQIDEPISNSDVYEGSFDRWDDTDGSGQISEWSKMSSL